MRGRWCGRERSQPKGCVLFTFHMHGGDMGPVGGPQNAGAECGIPASPDVGNLGPRLGTNKSHLPRSLISDSPSSPLTTISRVAKLHTRIYRLDFKEVFPLPDPPVNPLVRHSLFYPSPNPRLLALFVAL